MEKGVIESEKEESGTSEYEKGYFEAHEKFSNLLRTWFVSYGIGALAFIASQESILKAIQESPNSALIISAFMVGIVAQAIGAILFKYTMGYLYHAEISEELEKSCWYKFYFWVAFHLRVDAVIDIVTIISYTYATYMAITSVVT